ncbi:unnamed protein product [Toxocara canis]|uniref:DUF222 domain-containing protein n=1 Tax=Toxocara canis TaxID=6265 RepID=A0A183V9R1_TOXCA|nr:unnamed protein product [Toxocara canis]
MSAELPSAESARVRLQRIAPLSRDGHLTYSVPHDRLVRWDHITLPSLTWRHDSNRSSTTETNVDQSGTMRRLLSALPITPIEPPTHL